MFVVYLNLLRSTYNFLWNKDNQEDNHFSNLSFNSIIFVVVFACYFIILNEMIKSVSSINLDNVVFYTTAERNYLLSLCLYKSSSGDNRVVLFIQWKIGSTRWFIYRFWLFKNISFIVTPINCYSIAWF